MKQIIENKRINEKYIKIKHKSGCTLCLYPMEGFSTAYALFATKYGSVDTTFKTNDDSDFVTVPEGIAHYLEHKLFENDECDAFELYAKTGASANAFTSFDKRNRCKGARHNRSGNKDVRRRSFVESYV